MASDDNEVNALWMTVAAIYSPGQSKMRNQAPDVRVGITMSVAGTPADPGSLPHGCLNLSFIDFLTKMSHFTSQNEPRESNQIMLNYQGFNPFVKFKSLLLKVYSL